jgi:3-oxoacyl-(acyl-carrier-protein) synthase
MTAPNPRAIESVIQTALNQAHLEASAVDLISGHLTATRFDPYEVELWVQALRRSGENFPPIQALKSMTGHALSAAGALEIVALCLQLSQGFLHPNLNALPIHPKIRKLISSASIPLAYHEAHLKTGITASFGFGDVNACAVLRKWNEN